MGLHHLDGGRRQSGFWIIEVPNFGAAMGLHNNGSSLRL